LKADLPSPCAEDPQLTPGIPDGSRGEWVAVDLSILGVITLFQDINGW